MPTDDEVLEMLARALEPVNRALAPDRVAALRAAVARQAESGTRPVPGPRRHRSARWATIAIAAAAVLVAFLVGTSVRRPGKDNRTGGTIEFEAALRAPAGSAAAEVEGTKTGIGRIVRLHSDDLPILPKGEYYEVWFVGPGDTPAQRNRISAGTFHPDEQGRSDVQLTAAVDPAKYPELSVTAEPGDGDPAPNGPEVLRSRLQVRR